MSREPDSLRSIFFALAANGAIALAKLFAALHTGSHTMLAEAIHSFADCGNQGLLLLGIRHAKQPPSPDYPLGFGKAIYFWSFIVALILFSMGGLFSIYEGIHKLQSSEPMEAPWLAVGILIFAIVMEAVSLRACLREVNLVRAGKTLWGWFRETRQSALLVVLGEDVAALAGLAVALVAVLLAIATGDPRFDAGGSIGIGALLVLVAVGVGMEVKDLLIGQSVEPDLRLAIREHLEGRAEIARIFNIITLQLGPDIMVAVKAELRETESASQLIREINRCEADLKAAFPSVKWVFFEPDALD